ncbi:MAG: DUF1080 domain-containing protein [Verrucomicrobiota bacterium]
MNKPLLLSLSLAAFITLPAPAAEPIQLFNGKDLSDWNGDEKWFRVEDGAIVAGSLKEKIPHNYFLATDKKYHDFELTCKVKTLSNPPGSKINGGIQIRSVRVPNDTEMIGFQADIGTGVWGALYDESRRRKFLTKKPAAELLEKLIKKEEWNDYRIVCKDNHIQIFVNGEKLTDYKEDDEEIAVAKGHIALQVHKAPHPIEIHYKDLVLTPLGK